MFDTPVQITDVTPGWRARCVGAKSDWRVFQQGGKAQDLHAQTIGIAASFTAHNLVPFLGSTLVAAGFAPEIEVGPYNQIIQACLNPHQVFGKSCDVIVLAWRIEDLLADELAALGRRDAGALDRAKGKVAEIVNAMSALRANFSGTLIATVPDFPTLQPVGLLALENPAALGHFHREIAAHFASAAAIIPSLRLVDFDAVQRQVGSAAAFDSRQWYLYRQPYTDAFLSLAAEQIGRIIVSARRSAKKCIMLDCDNTLWGGIIGEDGLDGIELGDEYPGSAFRDFQRQLLSWRRQGIFLALLSKNNEADVWEVFDKHGGMLLRREDISACQVNWRPKAENVVAIAKALNIGTDSFVFIDDNPMEVDYMRRACPEVETIQLPADPCDIVPTLQCYFGFERLDITDEDLARIDMMRAEQARESLVSQMTKEDFVRTLELEIDLFPAGTEDLGRITQLINKTNQFNLTTIRRTVEEMRMLSAHPDHRVYGLRVADKFGQYGLTGVVVVDVSSDRRIWDINTLLLSCRVLGRGVETSLLASLAEEAAEAGARELNARFISTKKNSLANTFLPDHGFQQKGDAWSIAIADVAPIPSYVRRARSARTMSLAAQ